MAVDALQYGLDPDDGSYWHMLESERGRAKLRARVFERWDKVEAEADDFLQGVTKQDEENDQ